MQENPFKMPPDGDIFKLREKEKQNKLEVDSVKSARNANKLLKFFILKERERNKTLKVHQKLTNNTKLIEGMKAGVKPDISEDEKDDDEVI